MKKKLFAIIMSFCMAWAMLMPAQIFAEGESGGDQPGSGDPTSGEVVDTGMISEPFLQQDLLALSDAGKLEIPDSMGEEAGVSITKPEGSGGLMFTGAKAQLSSGKIRITDMFDFSGDKVGRISFDGLGDRKLAVSIEFYLDDEETPFAIVPLRNQMGKSGWTRDGLRTNEYSGPEITGEHSVSIRIVDNSSKTDDSVIQVLLRSLEFARCTVPVMYFDIDETEGTIAAMNADEAHDTECYGGVDIKVPEGFVSEYSKKPEDSKDMHLELEYIRGRGNSTWWADKKPYKLKLEDSTDLFGMGKNKHWLLIANRYDNSQMRNRMTYWLGAQLGLKYTPELIPVEVVMNGEYYGLYYLCEQVRVGKNRVNIKDLEDDPHDLTVETGDPNITGGYLVSMEPYGDESVPDNAFNTVEGVNFYLEHPSFEEYKNKAQLDYIRGYFQKTEDAIFGEDFKDKDGKSYSEYLDLDTAVDYHWIQMLSLNGDAYCSGSTYLYKDRDSKLCWGPLWDFDYVAWGDLEYNHYTVDGFNINMAWFDRMMRDPSFAQKFVERWPVIKAKMAEITEQGGLLDQYYAQLETSKTYDYEKWGAYNEGGGYYTGDGYEYRYDPAENMAEGEAAQGKEAAGEGNSGEGAAGEAAGGEGIDGEGTGGEGAGGEGIEKERTFREEVEQLRGWINQRVEWVDENVNDLIPVEHTITFKAGSKIIETRIVTGGDPLGSLPDAPEKNGYVFAGWHSQDDVWVDEFTDVFEDMVLTPFYIKLDKAVKAEKIYLKNYEKTLTVYDEDFYIDYTIMPENAYNRTVKWKSSDKSIAEVNSYGGIIPKKPGTVNITAYIKDGPKAVCKVTILGEDEYASDASSIAPDKTKITLKKGKYTQIRVKGSPAGSNLPWLEWISSNKKVVTVDDFGIVKARGTGSTDIFLLAPDIKKVKRIHVTVVSSKKANTMKAKGKTVAVKYSKLKKKTRTVKAKKAFSIKKAKGKVTFKKKSGKKKITVTRSGKIKIKKGLKKGKYKVRVKVTAAGNSIYKKKTETVTVTVRVR